MTGYRLLTYRHGGAPTAGVLVGQRVHPARELVADEDIDASSVLALLQDWPTVHAALAVATTGVDAAAGTDLAEVELLAPVLYPSALFCAGANYWDHIEEMEGPKDRGRRPRDPWFFVKTSRSVVGPGATVAMPAADAQLDWEAELAVVIGRTARHVDPDHALDVIAGYTIIDDLSVRDRMTRSDRSPAMTYDWVGQKCFDGAAPMGPWLTPAEFVGDPADLDITLWVNGEVRQKSNTGLMVHDIAEQVAWLSGQLTLHPGDVIATGTPAGVGLPRGQFLRPGDVVRIRIDGCGELVHSIG